eukprot:SAG31_NODE_2941_length_4879_cov_80.338075_2_plen_347_part_00
MLVTRPTDRSALLRLGFLHARPQHGPALTNYTAAADHLEAALAADKIAVAANGETAAVVMPDRRFWQELGTTYHRLGRRAEAASTFDSAAVVGAFPSRWQRPAHLHPRPLLAQPWWPKRMLPKSLRAAVRLLEEKWRPLAVEAQQLLTSATAPSQIGGFAPEPEFITAHLDGRHDSGGGISGGRWDQLILWERGKRQDGGCVAAPAACSLLEEVDGGSGVLLGCKHGQVKLSAIYPGTLVFPHTGTSNARLRMHLGLVVPEAEHDEGLLKESDSQPRFGISVAGGRPRPWVAGKAFVFDDSFEHSVVAANGTMTASASENAARVILIVDLYHPELSQSEIAALQPV